MSGGSYNYLYNTVEEEYAGRMLDPEMDALIEDLVPVLKAVEWYVSGDTGETAYRAKVQAFKEKWLRGKNEDVVSEIITQKCDDLKERLLTMWRGPKKEVTGNE